MLFAEQSGGFMTSIGFHSTDVFVQKCSLETVKLMPNMRNMVFIVTPKLVYEAARDYNKEKKGYDSMMNEEATITPEEKKKRDSKKNSKQIEEENQLKEQAIRNMTVLKIRKAQEQEQSIRIVKAASGKAVQYGSQIQLQHLDSGAFLQQAKTNSIIQKQCMVLELTSNPNPVRVTFEMLPRYKYRQQGDKVIYGDNIILLSSGNNLMLHYTTNPPMLCENNLTITATFRPDCPNRRIQIGAVLERFEVNIGSEAKKWQIFPYRQYEDEKISSRMIYGGSVLRLKHAESGGYICIDDDSKTADGQYSPYLRIYIGSQIGDDAEEQLNSNSLFEIEIDTDSSFGQACIWYNEKENKPINYRFRHLNSGRVLSVMSLNKNGKTIQILTSAHTIGSEHVLPAKQRKAGSDDQFAKEMNEEKLKSSLFILQSSTIDNDNFINNDSVVKIMSAMSNYYLTSVKKKSDDEEDDAGGETQDSAAEEIDILLAQEESPEFESQDPVKIYTPMNKEGFDFLRQQKLMLRKKHKEEDVYVLKKADTSEVADVLFIHSCVDSLKLYLYNIRNKKVEEFTVPYFVALEGLLSSMIFFLTETDSKDPFTCEGIPNQKRQRFMRETRVVDLFVDMIYCPFQDKLYNFDELTQKHPITRICQLAYRLLKHCVKEYNYSKFYVAQYIDFYFNQSMTATEQNNFRAEGTITELLKNNDVLLDKQITKDTIVNLVELCKGQKKNERFLNLLATMCSCNGEAVNNNQDDTCEIMLESDENNEALVMKITRSSDHEYQISIMEPDIETDEQLLFMNIADLYQISLKRDDLRIFNYFKALINLNAEMCLQRNYRGINPLVLIYPLEQVISCTINDNVHLLLRASFAKFLLHLHIDKDPLEDITVPNLARMWPDIVSKSTKLPKSRVPINPMLLKLKQFSSNFLGDLQGVQKAFEIDYNTYIVEVLGLIDAMVKLGFYNDEDDLIKVVDPMISLLDGSLDVIDKDQMNKKEVVPGEEEDNSLKAQKKLLEEMVANRNKRYKMNESNLLIMTTKTCILNTLHRILDIQNDVRLTKFLTEYFKDDSESPAGEQELRFIQQVNKAPNLEQLFKDDQELEALKPTIDSKVLNWINVAYADKKLDLQRIAISDFVCVLLDIILYENSALVNNAFKLLIRFFSQKQSIIDIASEVQVLEKNSDISILKTVQQQLTDMKREADNAEFWLGNGGETELVKARGFMESLDMLSSLCVKQAISSYDFSDHQSLLSSIKKVELTRLLKKGVSQLIIGQESEILNGAQELLQDWEDDDMRIVKSDEECDENQQRLLRNLKAHDIALIIVGQQVLDEAESQGAYLRVLERAYIFLIKFVRNNSENQIILLDHIDMFIDDVANGVHAFELIQEILKDNSKLSTFNLTPIIKRACSLTEELTIESPKKPTIMSLFQNFMRLNGLILKENQIMILNEVTNTNKKNLMHLFTFETGFEPLSKYIDEMKSQYSQMASEGEGIQLFLPNELSYTIQLIKILAVSGDGRNAMTELKCQSIFTIRDIVENLKLSLFCYPMKESCLDFLLQIYLDTEKGINEDYHASIWEAIEIVYEDLKKFVEMKIKLIRRLGASMSSQKKKSRPQNNASIEANGGVDISMDFTIKDCFGEHSIVTLMENYIYLQVLPTLTYFYNLRFPMNEKQTNMVRNQIRLIAECSKYCGQNIAYIRKINQVYNMIWKIPQLKEISDSLNNAQIALMPEKSSSALLASENNSVEITKAFQLKAYMKSANMSEEITNEIELEFQDLVHSIMFIRKKSELGFKGTNTLESEDIIKSLIKLTDVQSEVDIDCRRVSLKILRKMIEMENKDLTTPSAEWDTEDWSKYEFQVQQRQEMMTSLDMVGLVCRIISNDTDLKIKEQAFYSGIALLLGGNQTAQQAFCSYIENDSENIFVIKLKETIFDAYQMIKMYESKLNMIMSKQYSFKSKIDEMIEMIGDPDHPEVLKLQTQLSNIENEILELEASQESSDDNILTPTKALSYLQLILRFMQLLCENHNINLQNILREQINIDGNVSAATFDFISQLARMFGDFYKLFSSRTCDLGQQMLDTLIEVIQGPCNGNQASLIEAKIIDSSRDFIAGFEKPNDILPLGFSEEEEDIESIGEFKSKVVTLLLSLLEGDTDIPKITRMSNAVDYNVVKDRMVTVFKMFAERTLGETDLNIADLNLGRLNSALVKDSFEGSINEAFELYILLQTLAFNSDVAKSNIERKTFNIEQWKAFDFIRTHTGKIEVNVNSSLQNVFFPKRRMCHFIALETRRQLMQGINRDSHQSKIEELMNATPDLIDEMVYNEQLGNSNFSITPARFATIRDLSSGLAYALNLTMLLSFQRINNYRDLYVPQLIKDIIDIAGIVQSVLTGLIILFYVMARGGLITKQKWRTEVKLNKKLVKPFDNEDRLDVTEMSIEMTHTILLTKGPEAAEFNNNGSLIFGNMYTRLEYYIYNVLFFIQDGEFLYYCIYFIITLLGFLYLNIFYSFHLILDAINRSPTLQNVTKAVTQNGKSFMMTAMLICILFFVYTVIEFFYLQDTSVNTGMTINQFDDLKEENFCNTMIECFVMMLNLGLRNGGGIGDVTAPQSPLLNTELYAVQYVFDMTMMFLLLIIMISILFGSVIDTFSQLRDINNERQEDMQTVCFICNIERNNFDKYSEGFEKHIVNDHDLWLYIFYIVHLKSKDSTEYTGVESYVVDKFEASDISWVPSSKSICLQGTKYEENAGEAAEEE